MLLFHHGGACSHARLSTASAVCYCLALSGSFVGSLYLLCPARIRRLTREDARQIKWRTFATCVVCIGSLASYPFFFCLSSSEDRTFDVPPLLDIQRDARATLHVLSHTMILYLGPLMQMGVEVFVALKHDKSSISFRNYLSATYTAFIDPLFKSFFFPKTPSERWVRLRNLVIAPIAEEIVFRACIVPALVATGMRPFKTIMIAPCFFGIAHAHHALVRVVQNKEQAKSVLLQTIFQFAYTSLFGSYATYAYMKYGSVAAVTASHSFCNYMGLPNLMFVDKRSRMFSWKNWLWLAHFAGVGGFVAGFVLQSQRPGAVEVSF